MKDVNKDKAAWQDFLEESGYNDPSQVEIVQACRVMNVAAMRLFVNKLLAQVTRPDRFRILRLIETAFRAELGATDTNAWAWALAADNEKPPKRKYVNTTDEAELFKELDKFCQREIDAARVSDQRKEDAKEYLSLYMEEWKKGQGTAPEPQQELKELLPDALRCDEAVDIFQKAIDNKLVNRIGNSLVWNDSKQLLAYFAEKMSNRFELTTILDKDGKITISWKPFEKLFNKESLKGAKQDWMRLNTKFEPTGFEKVDEIM